jgi:hypothetical protein
MMHHRILEKASDFVVLYPGDFKISVRQLATATKGDGPTKACCCRRRCAAQPRLKPLGRKTEPSSPNGLMVAQQECTSTAARHLPSSAKWFHRQHNWSNFRHGRRAQTLSTLTEEVGRAERHHRRATAAASTPILRQRWHNGPLPGRTRGDPADSGTIRTWT